MCACVQAPPYMLGERPPPLHGGNGAGSFRLVPFVRVSERVENGIRVRKQLRKYLKASSTTQHLVAQMHLNDACVSAMQPQEVAQSCFEAFFAQMRAYNQVVGQKHLEASKAMLEMARPLDHSGKSRKWAREVYNLVQKCVQDVASAERRMDKARVRKERGDEDVVHWKRVLEANEATYEVQPSNPEVQRAYQLAQYRFANAFAEDEAATAELEDARMQFYASIERRDQVVEEATELSQSMEEDRLETMLIVMRQFVETKKAILQAEIEALSSMQRILVEMDRESVIQQYVVDAMQPELTHRQAKALYLLEWHRLWHHEQAVAAAQEPANYLALTPDEAARVKATGGGVSSNDIEVMKDFVVSCFAHPDRAILSGKPVSAKHRGRFTAPSSVALYRLPVVRRVILAVLHHQRTQDLELTTEGLEQLSSALRFLLDACAEADDARTIKGVMNMAQTFYAPGDEDEAAVAGKTFLLTRLGDHPIWGIPQYWGNALLLSIGEELSKTPQEAPWFFLPGPERAQLVLHVHNMVFGQVTSFVYNLESFGFSRRQITQYIQNVCFAYELGEDQRMALLSAVETLSVDVEAPDRRNADGDDVQFSALTLPDWTSVCGGLLSGQRFRPFRQRTTSAGSDTRSVDSVASAASTTVSTVGTSATTTTTSNSNSAIVRPDIEEMKQRAAAMINSVHLPPAHETWQELFGSAPAPDAASPGADGSEESKPKKPKPKNPRKFNEQLRAARAQSMSDRLQPNGDVDEGSAWPLSSSSSSGAAAAVDPSGAPPLTLAAAAATTTTTTTTTMTGPTMPMPPVPALTSDRDRGAYHVSATHANGGHQRKQSLDDAAILSQGEQESRQQRHRRVAKSRSAATIDTRDVLEPPPVPVDGADGATAAMSRRQPPGMTGMDHIKSIAAQMKQRREATGGATTIAASATARAASEDEAMTPRRLRKTRSSGAMLSIHSSSGNHSSSSSSTNAGAPDAPPFAAASSGVAALRARFERK